MQNSFTQGQLPKFLKLRNIDIKRLRDIILISNNEPLTYFFPDCRKVSKLIIVDAHK
jgi:hypothetical protein